MWFAIAVVLLGLVFLTKCGYTNEKTEHMTPNPNKQKLGDVIKSGKIILANALNNYSNALRKTT